MLNERNFHIVYPKQEPCIGSFPDKLYFKAVPFVLLRVPLFAKSMTTGRMHLEVRTETQADRLSASFL